MFITIIIIQCLIRSIVLYISLPDPLRWVSSSPLLSSNTIHPSSVLGWGFGLGNDAKVGIIWGNGGYLLLNRGGGKDIIIWDWISGVRTGTGRGIRGKGAKGGGAEEGAVEEGGRWLVGCSGGRGWLEVDCAGWEVVVGGVWRSGGGGWEGTSSLRSSEIGII